MALGYDLALVHTPVSNESSFDTKSNFDMLKKIRVGLFRANLLDEKTMKRFLKIAFILFPSLAIAATDFAFIPNNSAGTVSILNLSTNTTVSDLSIGGNPYGVDVNTATGKVFVSNNNGHTITEIDKFTNSITATYNLGSLTPLGVAASPSGNVVYATCQTNALPGYVAVIDKSSNPPSISTIDLTNGRIPIGVTFRPNSQEIYVAIANNTYGAETVAVINTSTNTIEQSITVGSAPFAIAFTSDGNKAYVTNANSNTVSVINAATRNVIATWNTGGSYPTGIAISADNSKIYVANYNSNNVTVLNTSNGSIAATINVGSRPFGLSFSSDGAYLYVTNYGSNSVITINSNDYTLINTINGFGSPVALGNFILSNAPTPPTNVVATAGPGQISVAFNTSIGVGPISYTATCTSTTPGAATPRTATGNTSPLVVDGATPGASYLCSVMALDTNGSSTATTATNGAVTPTDPPTPIPTLSEWAQILLALSLMGMAGWYWQRRAS